MLVRTTLPVARYLARHGGHTHAVNAAGGREDGSLVGFYTVCGREITRWSEWSEQDERIVTCGRCVRLLRPEDIVPEVG
jgi:hypothetical protein